MPTIKKRINISVSDDVNDALQELADRDQMPQATKAEQLLQLALEIEEDDVLNAIAHSRDTRSARLVSHKKAWG